MMYYSEIVMYYSEMQMSGSESPSCPQPLSLAEIDGREIWLFQVSLHISFWLSSYLAS